MGSLLRVAARLNFLTCVFFSMALAMSFSVGIGMFWKKQETQPLVQQYTSIQHKDSECVFLFSSCTLMLFRLTSVKVLSLFFTLCRVSSTLVGLGGSSNTGFIFSPLITSEEKTNTGYCYVLFEFNTKFKFKFNSTIVLTVVALSRSSPIICLITGDQRVNTQDCCKQNKCASVGQ